MEKSQLRQRLVGALVLVALLAIIVPFFLGDQPDMPPEHIASIPPAPEQIPGADLPIEEGTPEMPVDEVTTDTVVDAATPPATEPGVNADAVPAPSAPVPAPTKPSVPKPAPGVTPAASPGAARSETKAPANAWVVQLGSFSSEQNAWALRDKLRNKGYHAFVERVSEGSKMVIRVRIGPELQRAKAEAVQQKLEKEMKIKGIVMAK
jgi:DedD protein